MLYGSQKPWLVAQDGEIAKIGQFLMMMQKKSAKKVYRTKVSVLTVILKAFVASTPMLDD